MVLDIERDDQCAHAGCECPRSAADDYCGEYCRDAPEGIIDDDCECDHDDCA